MGHLKTKKQDVVFLQETHCCPQESVKLCRDWVGHVSFSAGSSKSRGVAILINKSLQFRLRREVKDEEGRIIIILAEIQGHALILANIYAHNVDQPNFFIDLESKLHNIGQYPIILGGDFNFVLDQFLDRSKPTLSRMCDSALLVKRICSSMGLIDVWRLNHPTDRDYTFYSGAHKVYSRIDFFLISSSLLPATLSCLIDSILLTDHAMVRLQMTPYQETERSQMWRFNSSLLQDVGFKEDLRAQIRLYVETNVPTAPSAIVAWEAMKAFIRGFIIQYSSYKKKVNAAKLTDLERRIKNIEAKLKRNISEPILKELTLLKYDYDIIVAI